MGSTCIAVDFCSHDREVLICGGFAGGVRLLAGSGGEDKFLEVTAGTIGFYRKEVTAGTIAFLFYQG